MFWILLSALLLLLLNISFLWSQSRWSDGESYRPPILADWSLLASCPTIHNIAYAISQYPQYCIYIVYMHLLSIHYPQYRIYTILGILWIDLISALLTICSWYNLPFSGKIHNVPPKKCCVGYPNCWAQVSLYLSDGQTNAKLTTVSPRCLFGLQNNVFFPFAALQGNMTLHNTRSHTSNVLQLYLYVLKEYTISPKNKEIQLCICNFWCHEYFKWVSVGMGG